MHHERHRGRHGRRGRYEQMCGTDASQRQWLSCGRIASRLRRPICGRGHRCVRDHTDGGAPGRLIAAVPPHLSWSEPVRYGLKHINANVTVQREDM